MDLSKFKTSDWLKVGGGALFFIAGFMNWWKVDLGEFGSAGASGWDYFFTTGIAWLLLVAVAVITVLRVMNMKLPADLPWPLVTLAATVVSLLLVLIRFLSDGFGDASGLTRGMGAFLGMIGAIAALAGAVMGFKESGGDFNDLKDVNKLKAEFAKGGDDTPPPPPVAPPMPQ